MDTAEYLKKVKKHIDEVIREKIKSGIDVPESKYLEIALQHTKSLYRIETDKSGSHRKYFWSREDLSGIMKLWESMRPELEKHIPASIMKYRSRKMVTEINAVSAEAQVSAAMKEAGLKHVFYPQTYRAKVFVKINDKHKLVVYLNYKKIGAELPKAIEGIKDLISALEKLGPSAGIQKTMWFDNFK